MTESLTITKDTVVSIDYTLSDPEGTVIDSSEGNEPLSYLHGRDQVIPGLERALDGKAEGFAGSVTVPPDQAYGPRDPERIFQVPSEELGFDAEVGQVLQGELPDGGTAIFFVAAVDGDDVTLDGNHPLAGVTLTFDITVTEVRAATDEEIAEAEAPRDEGEGAG